MSNSQSLSLIELRLGQLATVSQINQENDDIHCRMLSLGIYPGVSIEVLRSAPLGDPLQIRCGSTLISIRKIDAAVIQVTV